MTPGKLQIHTENILPIIKKWLYTEKEIFVRELISNACDALTKLRMLHSSGEAAFNSEEARIDLAIDKEKKTLTFTDNGIGMTADEVEKYIANVAFSSAEEFVAKYKQNTSSEPIIGHFGLGFFSAYMVAREVSLETLSYRADAEPVLWKCAGSVDYTRERGCRASRGTAITLFLDDDALEYLEEARLKSLLGRYCAFLPYPIFLNATRINDKEPLWLTAPSAIEDSAYLSFYRDLYPLDSDPIFWIHLNVDYPFHLQGILYFPKATNRLDFTKNAVQLFCSRVFVSDSCKEILPDYLTLLRGAIDSPDIPLNVSRSNLQMDRTVRQLSSHISKKVADRLTTLYQTQREHYEKIWPDIELVVKLGILQDDKFYEKIKPALLFKTLNGSFLALEDLLARASGNKIFYTSDEKVPSTLLRLYKNKDIEVVLASSPIDSALMNALEEKIKPVSFQRIDGALDSALLDPSKEKSLLDSEGKSEASRIASFFKRTLSLPSVEVEAKSLASSELPALLILDENSRRLRDHFSLTGQILPSGLSSKRTLLVNTNSALVNAIFSLKEKDPTLAADLVHQLFDLSLLSQKESEPATLSAFLSRTVSLLERLCASPSAQ